MTFTYQGSVLITDAAGHHVTLDNVRLWTETEEVDRVRHVSGRAESITMRQWRGGARVPGLLYRLLDILGERVTVTLPDGRTGKAYITAVDSVDSAWMIHIEGIGQPPT